MNIHACTLFALPRLAPSRRQYGGNATTPSTCTASSSTSSSPPSRTDSSSAPCVGKNGSFERLRPPQRKAKGATDDTTPDTGTAATIWPLLNPSRTATIVMEHTYIHLLFVEPFFSVVGGLKAPTPRSRCGTVVALTTWFSSNKILGSSHYTYYVSTPRNQGVWALIHTEKCPRRLGLGCEVKHISTFLSKLGVKAYRLQPSRAVWYF